MRSFLFAPAHKPALVSRALGGRTTADRIIVDLEDGVPETERHTASAVVRALRRAEPLGPPALCRVRAHGLGDDLDLVGERFDGVLIPKAESVDDVLRVERWKEQHGRELDVWLLVESARGLVKLDEMLEAGPVAGVMFGAGDFRADLRLGDDLRQLDAARARIVVSCVAAGVRHVVDTPEAQLEPDPAFYTSARSARDLGFTAKAAIHPAQLGAIHDTFRPTAADIERAAQLLAMPDGAVRDGGVMVDEATKRWAREVLAGTDSSEE